MQNLQHTGPWATQNSNVRYISEFFISSFRLKYCTCNFLCCFRCSVKTAFVLMEALWFLRKFSNNTTRKMIFPPQSLVNYYFMHSINSHIEIPYQGSWPPGLSSLCLKGWYSYILYIKLWHGFFSLFLGFVHLQSCNRFFPLYYGDIYLFAL